MSTGAQVSAQVIESLVEIGACEAVLECVEDVVRGLAGVAETPEFAADTATSSSVPEACPDSEWGGLVDPDRAWPDRVDDAVAESIEFLGGSGVSLELSHGLTTLGRARSSHEQLPIVRYRLRCGSSW